MASSSHPSVCVNPPRSSGKDEAAAAAASDHEKKSFEELMAAAPERYAGVISTLPCSQAWQAPIRQYKGYFILENILPGVMAVQDHFRSLPGDLILATQPKSGTTWLKALAFAVANRDVLALDHRHPLLSNNPHQCVPFLEIPMGPPATEDADGGAGTHRPGRGRILATHLPYSLLPASVRESECRLIFLARDPKDVFVSLWHALRRMYADAAPMDMNRAFELFAAGTCAYGPVWDQYLEYWKESQRRPEKVLFLKYEDMMEDATGGVRRMAAFMGAPFSESEERVGAVERVVQLCSFETMRDLEVNRNGVLGTLGRIPLRNDTFFREGKVGDWANHLSPEMAATMNEVCGKKLQESGLTFQ